MYRPSLDLKAVIDYAQTWKRVKQLLDNPAPIRPAPVAEHLRERVAATRPKLKLPQLKGNVRHTMEHIMHIFLRGWRRAKAPLNLAIITTNGGLAKVCGNQDPKTAYRHILTLIEHGLLRAKVRLQSRVQLLLNPALIRFVERTPAAGELPAAELYANAPFAALDPDVGDVAELRRFAEGLVAKFRAERPSPT